MSQSPLKFERRPATRALDRLATRRAIPLTVTFEVKKKCNLRCVHCYVDHSLPERFTTVEIKRVLDELAELGTLRVTITGGEIGLRKDIVEVIRYAKQEKRFAVKVNTSGTRFDDDAIERLVAAQPDHVDLSVYSHVPETHDAVTLVKGSWERTMRTVRALHAGGLDVQMQAPVMKQTVKDIPGIVALAQEIGCNYQFDPQVIAHESDTEDVLRYALNEQELRELMADPVLGELLGLRAGLSIFDGGESPHWRKPDEPVCATGRTTAFIDAGGHVFPCVAWREPLGNVLETSFKEIWWGNAKVEKLREMTLASNVKQGDLSDSGGLFHHCFGQAQTETGDPLEAVPSHRAMARAAYEAWKDTRGE